MTKGQTNQECHWMPALRAAVATGSHERVAEVFSLLIWQDGERISVRAKTFLEQFAPSYFAEKGLTAATIEERLRMETFSASVLAYLDGRGVEIELSVERDIATWIEANAPAMVSANLKLMEQQLGPDGFAAHRDQVKLHQLISLKIYEAVQQRALEKVWADIEADLAEVMAAAAR
ncbi:hypothetical protein [Halochromatium roseum]|uniref:hypothetical protein n=1 Tax=Halochromatium roseum TaxID=391920 RepID=UPI001911438C|nr:hypothetical protein [Halochromatium roseum]